MAAAQRLDLAFGFMVMTNKNTEVGHVKVGMETT
jgi:hypothetical protein